MLKRLVEKAEKHPLGAIGAFLIAVLVGGFAFLNFLDWRVERQLLDESNVRKLTQLIRPSCIFNERKSVLYDSGVMDSVADIQLEPGVKQKGEIGYGLPGRIVVKLKKHTPYAPLLTLLDPYYAGVTVERGPMFDWIFIISYEGQAGTVVEGKCRYRLELL